MRAKRLLLGGLQVTVCALLLAASAQATSVIAKSFAALATEADQIFAGTVNGVRSFRKEDGRIWTAVRFSELTWIAGEEQPEVELLFAGGKVGDRAEMVGGMPRFEEGQRVLLFVGDRGSASPIVGFHQGCFSLQAAGNGEVVTTPDRRPVLSIANGQLTTGSVAATDGAMSLADFARTVSEIRAEAGK